jgi:hypothetical protein
MFAESLDCSVFKKVVTLTQAGCRFAHTSPYLRHLRSQYAKSHTNSLSNHVEAMTEPGSARMRGSRHKHPSIFRPSEEMPYDEVIRIDLRFKT